MASCPANPNRIVWSGHREGKVLTQFVTPVTPVSPTPEMQFMNLKALLNPPGSSISIGSRSSIRTLCPSHSGRTWLCALCERLFNRVSRQLGIWDTRMTGVSWGAGASDSGRIQGDSDRRSSASASPLSLKRSVGL